MILAILAAATVAAAEAPAANSAPPTDVAPVEVETDTTRHLRELQRIYAQSCSDRAYMTFNEACANMAKQVRAAEREARKAGKKR